MAQNELEWLELNSLPATTIRFISSGLQSSSHIFGAIRFYKIDFNLFWSELIIEGLSSCVNLLCLDFYECDAIEQNSWIETAKFFTKLEFLAIEGTFGEMPLAFIKQIIETSGDNLLYLLIQETRFLYTSDEGIAMVAELLPFILVHSRNLRALSLGELNLEQISSLPESCPKLKHVDFYTLNISEELPSLGQSLPPQISSLAIYGAALTHAGGYFYGFNKNFLEAICCHVKYLSIFIDVEDIGYATDEIEFYGIKYIEKPFHDVIYPSYFPQF
ncbi:3393_t:CDS:2 [Ambispora gerdemannii]|uniref:3393_t:CDS:1 n=1 Tax=Ambispora gerdemannii TaxID=144530 RepID=A0A9N9F0E7_9GLOM|nr:3393_t:CDS:2 [Ambispora gerdemannii]